MAHAEYKASCTYSVLQMPILTGPSGVIVGAAVAELSTRPRFTRVLAFTLQVLVQYINSNVPAWNSTVMINDPVLVGVK